MAIGMTPERKALLPDLLLTARSLREIATILGVSNAALRAAAKPLIEQMDADGTRPRCDCGQPRFHPRGCAGNQDGAKREEILAKREAILGMIRAGDSYHLIAQVFGVTRTVARDYTRYLTPDELTDRRALDLKRGHRPHSEEAFKRRIERYFGRPYRRRAAA